MKNEILRKIIAPVGFIGLATVLALTSENYAETYTISILTSLTVYICLTQ